jgi:exodeoxyribonuclease VII large subunit
MGGVDPAGVEQGAEVVSLRRGAGGSAGARRSGSPSLTVLPLFEPTYSVSQLCGEVQDFLHEAFPSVWVTGEVQKVNQHSRGHVYFELIEKGDRDEIKAKLDAVIWKTDFQRIQRLLAASEQRLAPGVQIRCRGDLNFYAPQGRMQLCVREVDPAFTLGLLERRRRETLAALTAAGLMERNRGLPLSDLPLAIALITSKGSAAYEDFVSGLRESGFGFRVLFIHAAVQGREAEREVVSALAALARRPVDCAVVIRGGGSRTDLAAFDSRAIAEAIARAPFPVLTGLGHEIDRAIADLVCHTAFKTPTKVAEFLVERVAGADFRVEELRRTLVREALEPLRAGREALGRAERGVSLARMRLAAAGGRIEEHARALARLGRSVLREAERSQDGLRQRLAELAPRQLGAREHERFRLAERIAGAGRGRVREVSARLQGLERLCQQLAPERTLERGFSLTRDAFGRVVRHPAQVRIGDLLATRVAGGELKSRVEES